MLTLRDIENGKTVVIKRVYGRSNFRRRISEMGFVKGKKVTVLKNAPFRDPIEYEIMGYFISLRRSEAALIEVMNDHEAAVYQDRFNGTLTFDIKAQKEAKPHKELRVAFVGNPNSGKTSIFNALTGKHEHVGNYTGVTVDAKKAKTKFKGYVFHFTDLPGTYSLSPNSPDEIFVRDSLLKEHHDVVINVVDSTNLERNLYLTTQLIDMDIPIIIALNMQDEMKKSGEVLDTDQFSRITGIPTVWTIGTKKTGSEALLNKAIEVAENIEPDQRHIHINYDTELEKSINTVQKKIWQSKNYVREFSSRYFALRLLDNDEHTKENISYLENSIEIIETAQQEIQRLENLLHENTQTLITDARYGFIRGALKETLKPSSKAKKQNFSQKIDELLTGKYTGFPLFLLLLWIMFQTTFKLGQYPAEWINLSVSWLGNIVGNLLQSGPVRDLIVDGIFGGVGGVLVFLPNIVILFFFISLMEDTGYMSRVAFIMDKLMHLIGLHGKSFIPLIMGFGCNVPAIMATRTLENRSDRILTILIIPFMSCSARLPVYILIAGAIFPKTAGTVIFAMYMGGIVLSILTALLLKKTIFKAKEAPFVMELPPYRIPTLKSTLRHMWDKAKEYLKKMGGIILWASVIVWFLSYFPRTNEKTDNYQNQLTEVQSQISTLAKNNSKPANFMDELKAKENNLLHQINEEQQYNSYLGRTGRFIEPVLRPMGFDWKIGVSLLSGVIAKEIVISTLGVLYSSEDDGSLKNAIQKQTHLTEKLQGQKIYTKSTSLAFLVFVLIYVPCIAVIAAIRKETGKWKWAIFNITYATSIAWIISFAVAKISPLFF